MKNLAYFLVRLVALTVATIIVIGLIPPKEKTGSVSVTNEYNSTSTGITNWDMINTLKTGAGTLGSVTITTAGSGKLTLYDATTSNAYLRQISANASTTTSSLVVLAQFATTASALGTYVFDNIFTKGLLMVWEGTKVTLGSTTIMWR